MLPMTTDRDLSGRTVVITGANTGIGRATAVALGKRGARVVLACRSEEKTRPVIDAIRAAGGEAEFLALDLSSLADVRRAAAELLDRGHPIHVLINNAGLAGQRGQTKDGFELAFGTNHLAHFLWTQLLLDRVRQSAPSRIVIVASASHYSAKAIDWDALRRPTATFSGVREYEVSKLANVLHAQELSRRLEGTGVTTYSLHPGVIASDIWRRIPWPIRPLATVFMKTIEQGAQTTIHCATSPSAATESGLYYHDSKPRRPGRLARDPDLGPELWRRSEEYVAS
jgi:retinol dehydrogenase 12